MFFVSLQDENGEPITTMKDVEERFMTAVGIRKQVRAFCSHRSPSAFRMPSEYHPSARLRFLRRLMVVEGAVQLAASASTMHPYRRKKVAVREMLIGGPRGFDARVVERSSADTRGRGWVGLGRCRFRCSGGS